MTELQRIEFEMLQVFVNVCDKLNLKYYLVCGSALGAVKYSGFIPWDDDLDVALAREDYEIFCEEASDYLPNHIFLQNYQTNSNVPYLFSKLRNVKTTFIERSVAQLPIKHGAYIDIFPLDGYPHNKKEIEKLEILKKLYTTLLAATLRIDPDTKFFTRIVFSCLQVLGIRHFKRFLISKQNALYSQYPIDGSEYICNHGNWQGKLEYAPREQYGDGIWATFEGLKVRIPEKYDEYLTQKYGDWRADLPEDQKVGHHYAEVIDLTHPYTDYIVKLKNGKIRLKTSEELLSAGITPPEGYKY